MGCEVWGGSYASHAGPPPILTCKTAKLQNRITAKPNN